MRWRDGRSDYGWVSIGLHWLGAALILTLLFVGNSIRAPQAQPAGAMLRLHTTLALSGYALLWARAAWRWRAGHPGPLPRQGRRTYGVGKAFHHLLLAALAAMLLSGPLMAWSGGISLYLGPLALPGPPLRNPALFALARGVHVLGANILGYGALVHILAVIKHTAVDRDGSIDRILVPLEPAGEDRAR